MRTTRLLALVVLFMLGCGDDSEPDIWITVDVTPTADAGSPPASERCETADTRCSDDGRVVQVCDGVWKDTFDCTPGYCFDGACGPASGR